MLPSLVGLLNWFPSFLSFLFPDGLMVAKYYLLGIEDPWLTKLMSAYVFRRR